MPGITALIIFFIFFLLMCALAGGITYRGRGGPLIKWPRPFEQMAFCSFILPACALMGVPHWVNAAVYMLAVAACCTGHGQYFLSLAIKALEPERFDFLLRPFFGSDPRHYKVMLHPDNVGTPAAFTVLKQEMERYGMKRLFWRCLAGMAITGGSITLAPGVAIAFQNLWAGVVVAASGFIVKPLAYFISHKVGHDTEGGEWGFGGALWPIVMGTVAVALFMGMVCL